MKVRLRQHELIFTSIIGLILLGSFLWHVLSLSPEQIDSGFALPFIQNHVPFNIYRHVIWPNICVGLLIYGAYLFVNYFTIPRLLLRGKAAAGTSRISVSLKKFSVRGAGRFALNKFGWLILQVVLLILLLGIGLNAYAYFTNECYFSYNGFTFFPGNGYHPQPQMGLQGMFFTAFAMMGIYAIYAGIREGVIYYLERPGTRRDYRILIFNQVTLFLIQYLLVPFFLISFDFIHSYIFFAAYFALVPSLLLVFMINIYVLFPWKGQRSFFNSAFTGRLLITTFLCSLPFSFFLVQRAALFITALFILWLAQLLIVTPVSWLDYQHRKDKIRQLKGAQNELVKSKTDLQFLKSQINPHFLFNVLNTLYGTALQESAERTAGGIQKLGEMMRFMLHENNRDFIQMEKEIEYLRNYISLQKLRIRSSSDIMIDDHIDDRHYNHRIAPMLLIPFVENAFKHGISLHHPSWVKISLTGDEKNIYFKVTNSMQKKQESGMIKDRSGIGFDNVLARLKLIYGDRFQISVHEDGNEFFVQLTIQP